MTIKKKSAPAQGAPSNIHSANGSASKQASGSSAVSANGGDGELPFETSDSFSQFSGFGELPPSVIVEKMLKDSAISQEVADARPYSYVRKAETSTLLELGFGEFQCKSSGILIPIHSVNEDEGVVLYQYRPDTPRTDNEGKIVKYEIPLGSRLRLDVNPLILDKLMDPSVSPWVTEGSKKADAAISAGLCCVGLLGVWGFMVEDWEAIPLSGRDFYICYDSDVMRKNSVEKALHRFTVFLSLRGARVRWVMLPEGEPDAFGDSAKVGLDDYLADGHSVDDLMALVRKPRIGVNVGRQIHDCTLDAIAGLHVANENPFLFQRADALVEVRSGKSVELRKDRATYVLGKYVDWYRTKKVKEEAEVKVPDNPREAIVKNVLAAYEDWPYPVLNRVVTCPVFGKEGSLRTEPGYDTTSGNLYVPPPGLVVPSVPTEPSLGDIDKALMLLMEMFEEFPFKEQVDRTNALALLLQPFARDLIRGPTPLYGVESPTPGTGKTLLVQTALAPGMGAIAGQASPGRDDEMEKRITAAMASAQSLFFIDNVSRPVNWSSLTSAITTEFWEGRILGETRGISVPTSCTWVITANNPRYSAEMDRRVVRIRLDSGMEKPHSRERFKLNLPEWAYRNRGRLIWAACTLIQYWIELGRPAPDETTPRIGKFEAYRYVMGGIFKSIGESGFLTSTELYDSNPELEAFRTLAHHVAQAFGLNQPFTSGQVRNFCNTDSELYYYVDPSMSSSEQGFSTKVGHYLTRHVNQVVDNMRLEFVKTRGSVGGNRYRFVKQS